MIDTEDYALDDYDEAWFDEEEDDFEYDCGRCGPWCDDWGGDNICLVDCENLANQTEEFLQKHHHLDECPICKKQLPGFEIPVDELWIWPGGWYDPRICIFEVYGMYGTPKGVIHSIENVHHIWTGNHENEKIIRLYRPASTEAS